MPETWKKDQHIGLGQPLPSTLLSCANPLHLVTTTKNKELCCQQSNVRLQAISGQK